jgi:hypothetical protein
MQIETGADRAPPVVFLAPAGDGDERYLGSPRALADALRHLVTVYQRHPDVEQREAGLEALGDFQSFEPVLRCAHLVAVQPDQAGESLGGVAVVIDNQHLEPRSGR